MASQAAPRSIQNASLWHGQYRKYVIWSATALAGATVVYAWYRWRQQQYGRSLHADAPRNFDSETGKIQIVDNEKQTAEYLPDWSDIGDKIKDAVVPGWAQELPSYVTKLQHELSEEDGSLAQELWQEAHDPRIHPEIGREASVRVGDELCAEEKRFIKERKHRIRKALARYLAIPEDDVHPDDVPVIGMCGSGGGLRAMVAGGSSYYSAQAAGLFDCVTYTAGVSGSCWLQSLYHSTLTNQNFAELVDRLKSRISTHIAFPPPVFKLLTNAPTHKYLLAGALEKWKGMANAEFGVVDVYGLLLGARLMVPKGELDVNPANLKLSHQRKYIDTGDHPMPIYAAVRHEIPSKAATEKDGESHDIAEQAQNENWFQWFEFTPYELWCEEFASGIPTWAVGRSFQNGRSIRESKGSYMPEIRIPLLQGIWGSAFCATLWHYYQEIAPLVKGLISVGGIDKMLDEYDDDLSRVHPLAPSQIPNYVKGMKEQLPERCPESIHDARDIQLMDAGMSNNLPIYPLLRPGRDVDIVIAFDASADVKKDDWLRVVDGYARQRGIQGWPIGTGWVEDDVGPEKTGQAIEEAGRLSPVQARDRMAEAAQDQEQHCPDANKGRKGDTTKVTDAESQDKHTPNADSQNQNPNDRNKDKSNPTNVASARRNLDYCTIWVGTTEERSSTTEPPPSKAVEEDWELMQPNAGIAVVYFPFIANPRVKGIDPEKSEFLSTFNFIYTPEEIDRVVALAKANFKEGEEKTKRAIRAVYERKRRARLEREERAG